MHGDGQGCMQPDRPVYQLEDRGLAGVRRGKGPSHLKSLKGWLGRARLGGWLGRMGTGVAG